MRQRQEDLSRVIAGLFTNQEGKPRGKTVRIQARRVLLQQLASGYRQASASQKQAIVEALVTATGYEYKYARWLLNHVEEVLIPAARPHQRYGPEVEEALVLAWKTLNRMCAKRLIPFLPEVLETLEERGHVQLSQDTAVFCSR